MANFAELLKQAEKRSEDNMTYTENGDLAYVSTKDAAVDALYSMSSFRNKDEADLKKMFNDIYNQNPEDAARFLFYTGDVRKGAGERKGFKSGFDAIVSANPELAAKLVPFIPEYSRWDVAINLIKSPEPMVSKAALDLVKTQFRKDLDIVKTAETSGKTPEGLSLCAKWLPALGSDRTDLAIKIANKLNMTKKEYRQARASVNKQLHTFEIDLSAKNLDNVDFSKLTSKNHLEYKNALSDNKMYQKYIQSVQKGEVKMNVGVLSPGEIIHRYISDSPHCFEHLPANPQLETMWEEMQKARSLTNNSSVLVVLDTSGSMFQPISKQTSMTCEEAAMGLAIMSAEMLQGPFKDKIISFSESPKFIDLSNNHTLHDKIRHIVDSEEIANTNIEKTFDLILKTAVDNRLSQEDLPSSVVIFSDMQFDEGQDYEEEGLPIMEIVREKFKDEGYEMPTLVYWNLYNDKATIPEMREDGMILTSGYSSNLFESVFNKDIKDFSPREFLDDLIYTERYDEIGKVVQEHYKQFDTKPFFDNFEEQEKEQDDFEGR